MTKSRTYVRHAGHVSIPIEDVRRFGVEKLIDAAWTRMSLKTVHLDGQSWERVKAAIENQGYAVNERPTISERGYGGSRRIPYDADLVARPLSHGDLVRLADKDRTIGILVIRDGTMRVAHARGIYRNKNIARLIVERIDATAVPAAELRAMRDQAGHPQERPKIVEMTVHARTPLDPGLAAYLANKGAAGEDGLDPHGAPASIFTFRTTAIGSRRFEGRAMGRRSRRNRYGYSQKAFSGIFRIDRKYV